MAWRELHTENYQIWAADIDTSQRKLLFEINIVGRPRFPLKARRTKVDKGYKDDQNFYPQKSLRTELHCKTNRVEEHHTCVSTATSDKEDNLTTSITIHFMTTSFPWPQLSVLQIPKQYISQWGLHCRRACSYFYTVNASPRRTVR